VYWGDKLDIYSDIKNLKGVGPKALQLLNKSGIYNLLDLLLYFPREYENITSSEDITNINGKEKLKIKCKVLRIFPDKRTKTGKTITTIAFSDGENTFYGKWFNQPYVKKKYFIDKEYTLIGEVKKVGKDYEISNPKDFKEKEDKEKSDKNIIPKYPLKAGLTNNFFIKLITSILEAMFIRENLPEWIIEKYKLCSLDYAIRNIHYPKEENALRAAERRLKFQELFTYSLKILMLKEYVKSNKEGIAFKIAPELVDLKNSLPFQLTDAQSKAVREILSDMKKPTPMNRLLQGDVGSGKTIVALIALFNAAKNQYQGVLMAPTEILANQHYHEFIRIMAPFNIKIELLTGSTTKKQKERIKEEIKGGKIDILIGTHALIEDDVQFENLGIIVTDEQHRFGVMQRNKLFNKGKNIDVLVMTATPIPRTLALYLYGDLEVSIIDQLPPGREKIETKHGTKKQRDNIYEFSKKSIKEGRQVYVVCPLVEDNEVLDLKSVEALFIELKESYFKDYNVGFIHGKMSPKDKDKVINEFKNKETQILVATTVIEVGINVPNANIMIIENAERFGLAQLHQLRGRVGRGQYKSYCFLIADTKSKVTEKRMKIMEQSNDGFFIAEEDLKIRGTGEVFGLRQSGENGLLLSDVIEDINILKCANKEAKELVASEKLEDIQMKEEVMKSLEKHSKYICFN